MDKDNILFIGLTAAALGLSIFILWGPKLGKRSRNQCSLVGLQNLGLTCFLNSLLQALASCPLFFEWIQTIKEKGPVSESLYNVLHLLCYQRKSKMSEEIYSPAILIRHLRGNAWPTFPQEQDPHELFLHVLSTLEDEEIKATPERGESLLDALGTKEEQNFENPNRVGSHGDVPVFKRFIHLKMEVPILTPSPFRGYLASQLSCLNCGSKSAVVYDKFDTLTLPLPSVGICFKLQRLLSDFVSTELVEGFSCDNCNKGKNPSDPPILTKASKAIKIGKLPKCLCLHISRTYMNTDGYMYKRDNYVDFSEYLPMFRYTHNSSMLNDRKAIKAVPSNLPQDSMMGGLVNGEASDSSLVKFNSIDQSSLCSKASSIEEEFLTPMSPSNSPVNSDPLSENNNKVVASSFPSIVNSLSTGPIYRLKAVVEHRGNINNGHFVTYRRGPLQSEIRHRSSDLLDQSESRWFYTSDDVVQESTLCEALQATAYLIFYEKCSADSLPAPIQPSS